MCGAPSSRPPGTTVRQIAARIACAFARTVSTLSRPPTRHNHILRSMGDVAASGGYYIAAAADAVVAQPGTVTGSIGVVAGKINVGRTLEDVGVRSEGVTVRRLAAGQGHRGVTCPSHVRPSHVCPSPSPENMGGQHW